MGYALHYSLKHAKVLKKYKSHKSEAHFMYPDFILIFVRYSN